jgi:hypothetical protein
MGYDLNSLDFSPTPPAKQRGEEKLGPLRRGPDCPTRGMVVGYERLSRFVPIDHW